MTIDKENASLELSLHNHQPDKVENKIKNVLISLLKIIGLLACLYFFVVSLNLMSISFPLIGGRYASEAFRSSVVLTNPFAGLMIGLLSTVIIQSSSTSTSIIVSMVASEIIPVKFAIPIIMGTNIGTSVTSTLVALGQAADKEKFRLSFAGATIHDMFNVISVLVLLPLEMATNYLERTSQLLVKPLQNHNPNAKEPELLNAITKPLTNAIIQIEKSVLDKIATNQSSETDKLIKQICKKTKNLVFANNSLNITDEESNKCNFLFADSSWPEWSIGLILLLISLITLSTCLVFVVKILSSIFNGPVANLIQKIVNGDLPGPLRHFTALIAILMGCVLTIIVQSSSVFTSTLTPLVGMGIVTIERVFPLTLGSNVGTTITGILASLSGPARTLHASLQIALCHTIFNITGILIWYPIPFLRKIPLDMAKCLGDVTAEYRWFAFVYIIGLFFVIPLITFVLSLLGKLVFMTFLFIILSILVIIFLIKYLQKNNFDSLPLKLQTWDFLPVYLRSLKPYDNFIVKYLCFGKMCSKITNKNNDPKNKIKSENDLKIVVFTNNAYHIESF